MKVRFIGWGILKDCQGNEYICAADEDGNVKASATGELYQISKRDENDNPVEISKIEKEG